MDMLPRFFFPILIGAIATGTFFLIRAESDHESSRACRAARTFLAKEFPPPGEAIPLVERDEFHLVFREKESDLDLLEFPTLRALLGRVFVRATLSSFAYERQRVPVVVSIEVTHEGVMRSSGTYCLSLEWTEPRRGFVEQFLGVYVGAMETRMLYVAEVANVFAAGVYRGSVRDLRSRGDSVLSAGIWTREQHWRTLEMEFDDRGVVVDAVIFNPLPHPPDSHGGEPCRRCSG